MKILFLGLGSIGQRHLRNILTISNENIEILAYRVTRETPALNDRLEPVGESSILADKYNITEFSDLTEALNEKPDIAFITNPSSLHVDSAIAAARSGCHLFIEKPLSDRMAGLDTLREIIEKQKLVATVAYQFRYHPAIIRTKEWLDNNSVGNLVSVKFYNGEYMPGWHPYEDYRKSYAARSNLGGGAIISQIHEFDLALYILGIPDSIYSVGGKLSDLEIDVEDSVSILMSYKNKYGHFPVSIDLDYLQSPPKRGFTIVGDRGRIEWDYFKNTITLESRENKLKETINHNGFERNNLFISELKEFLKKIKGEKANIVDFETGCQSLKMALAAKESMNTNKVIKLQ